jgi:hypothetical protein
VPDAPINIFNDPTVTDANRIKFTWTEGPSDGGMPVLDFDVYYDQGSSSWVLLEEGVVPTEYTTSVALTADLIYAFKLTARNSVGDSVYSEQISIRAAKVPDAPLNLRNLSARTSAYQVGLAWDEGAYNGGSAVLDYRITFKEESALDFQLYKFNFTQTDMTLIGLTPGATYNFRVEARNLVGYSAFSNVLVEIAAQVPDEPQGLVNVPEVTARNQAGLSWAPAAFDGGSQVLDFALWYD